VNDAYEKIPKVNLYDRTKLTTRDIILFVTANEYEKEAVVAAMQPYKGDKLELYIGRNNAYLLGRIGK
jgi:hypothetical protein